MYPNKGWASTQPYEYSDYNSSDEQSPTFDSYTIPEDDLELGQSRLLEVENRVKGMVGDKPIRVQIRERLGQKNGKSKSIKGFFNKNFKKEFLYEYETIN